MRFTQPRAFGSRCVNRIETFTYTTTYLHSHIDLVYCVDSLDGGVEDISRLNVIVYGGEAHL